MQDLCAGSTADRSNPENTPYVDPAGYPVPTGHHDELDHVTTAVGHTDQEPIFSESTKS